MDGQRFDAWSKLIGAGVSRRKALAMLAGVAFGVRGGRRAGAQETCAAEGESCAELGCCQDLTCCGSICRNTGADPANCGDCGFTCGAGEICDNYACRPGDPCVGVTCGDCQYCDFATGACRDDCTWNADTCCGESGICNLDTGRCDGNPVCSGFNDPCGFDFPPCCGGLECDFSETCQPFQPQCGFEGSACFGDIDCCTGLCCDGTCHENYVCCPADFVSQSPDCAPGETCDNNGFCTPIPCGGPDASCQVDGDCCDGICCNGACRQGVACCSEEGNPNPRCASGEICDDDGICVPEPICSATCGRGRIKDEACDCDGVCCGIGGTCTGRAGARRCKQPRVRPSRRS